MSEKQRNDELNLETLSKLDPSERRRILRERFQRELDDPVRRKMGALHDSFFHAIVSFRPILVGFLKTYFPQLDERFDIERAEALPNDLYDKTLTKRIADCIVLIPRRDEVESGALSLRLILEHKAQSGSDVDATAIGNIYQYVVWETLQTQRNFPKEKVAQAIAVIVYNGPDPQYDSPSWEEHFPLPEELKECQLRMKVPCVNLSKLLKANALKGDKFVRVTTEIFALGGGKLIKSKIERLAELLNELRGDDDISKTIFQVCATYALFSSSNANQPLSRDDFHVITNGLTTTGARNEMDTMVIEIDEARIIAAEERGEERGEKRGKKEAVTLFRRQIVQTLLEKFGDAALEYVSIVNAITDLKVLDSILSTVIRSKNLSQIKETFDDLLVTRLVDARSQDRPENDEK